MINVRGSKIQIIFACWLIVLFMVIASHVILKLEINHDDVFVQKQVTLSDNLGKTKEENSNFRKILKEIKEFPNRKINESDINKEQNVLVTKYDELNQLQSNKIESEINLNDQTKYFSIFTKNNDIFKKPSNSNEKLTYKINEDINETNDSNDLILNRNVRSINRTEYYAQRKAVMDKFHARQREISKKYGKQYYNNTSIRKNNQTLNEMTKTFKKTNNSTLDILKVASNNTNIRSELNNKTNQYEKDTEKKRFQIYDNSIKDITNYTSILNNKINKNEENTEKKRSWISDNSLGDVTNYTLSSNHNCTNLIVHGNYLNQNQLTISCLENRNEMIVKKLNDTLSSRPIRATNGELIWGTCNGTLVYEHNFSLNINGPSILETDVEIIVDGPLCITCITILPYNDTKEDVTKVSGGEGFSHVTIKFKNSENKGFSYKIRIFAVVKRDDNCS
ncbi:PREDICTED: GATA zinc finger domain-containing protein 14-like [Polistes dominula]|uniref:GATA zinc finger domain-containing protein 14-like n=1 Tax=Polistes dominula TaxID=743375 RepID=A0ABM1IW09_POLDO|nr:PREDICTED: GATA zinc finger domain-containing protein 14-like [Polistes dominula]